MTFLLRYWRFAAAALLLAAAWAWVHNYGHGRYEAGRASGEASEHSKWVADTAARDKVAAEAIAAARHKEEAARVASQEITDEYTQKLVTIAGERDGYFGLLQRARGQVRSCSSARATDSTIAAATSEATIAERIDRATAGLITEARGNAEQLDALIAVIKPQMESP